jgi:hypothetical protein
MEIALNMKMEMKMNMRMRMKMDMDMETMMIILGQSLYSLLFPTIIAGVWTLLRKVFGIWLKETDLV